MRHIIKYSGVVLMAIALTGGLAGCSKGKKSSPADQIAQEGNTLFEGQDQSVKIVDQDTAAPANEHPILLSSDELRTVLASLYVTESVRFEKTENPVFSIGELQILTASLASGLARASSKEDITFVVKGNHPSALGSKIKVNSGRVFMQGGKLNIIFGLLHDEYKETDSGTGQTIDRRTNPLLPGTRKSEANLADRIALYEGQSYYLDPETGEERTDWLVIDIQTVLAAAKQKQSDLPGTVSPEMLEDIARTKQEAKNLRKDVTNLKEMIFDMSDEIDSLKKQLKEAEGTP
ncbi:MAG: hypothetical protein DRP42_02925 [Tenericutes bacterium]|nr:MAG: hypothetical protein DRP42_02925 [Mycoplasmatota bacterium]